MEEEVKNSKIDIGVTFVHLQFPKMEQLIHYRQNNMETTEMLWIRKRPVVDCLGEPYNPKSLIMVHKN